MLSTSCGKPGWSSANSILILLNWPAYSMRAHSMERMASSGAVLRGLQHNIPKKRTLDAVNSASWDGVTRGTLRERRIPMLVFRRENAAKFIFSRQQTFARVRLTSWSLNVMQALRLR